VTGNVLIKVRCSFTVDPFHASFTVSL